MTHAREHLSLAVALAASVLLHLIVLLPWMHATLSSAGEPASQREIALRPDDVEPPPPLPEQSMLGIDADTPSSLTWVGYKEYQEHLARLAEIEQAAFTQNDTGAPEVLEVSPPAEVTAVTLEPDSPAEARLKPNAGQETSPDAPIPDASPANDAAPQAQPRFPLMPLIRLSDPVMYRPIHLDAEGEEGESPEESVPPARDSAAEQKVTEPNDSTDSGDQKSAPPPSPPRGEPEPGERSDRESEATSVIDAPPENWKLGKPLSAPGVELKPQRPDFTLLQRLTLSPCSPLVEIRFGADGRPRLALIHESSGSGSVDAAVEASLYRWRASGEVVDRLEKDQTFNVVIRLVLNQHCP